MFSQLAIRSGRVNFASVGSSRSAPISASRPTWLPTVTSRATSRDVSWRRRLEDLVAILELAVVGQLGYCAFVFSLNGEELQLEVRVVEQSGRDLGGLILIAAAAVDEAGDAAPPNCSSEARSPQ